MRHTSHIHIKGLVQGVGFRPFVCRLAATMQLNGWVSNTNDGVHIEITGSEEDTAGFYHALINDAPVNAVITSHQCTIINTKEFNDFIIAHSSAENEPDLLLTPDIAVCEACKNEIGDTANKRYDYAFTTCLNCGPRYSIINALPYDRENTTMREMEMCDSCAAEYHDVHDRRHYSQTNSCTSCAIHMHLYQSKNEHCNIAEHDMLQVVSTEIKKGKIIAVKAMSGYLLVCDATNKNAIQTLRQRKQRPAKPFALLYSSVEAVAADVYLQQFEAAALQSKAAPIVLCRKRSSAGSSICADEIAPALDKIGVMLPSTPLLHLLAVSIGTPVIATSGNISGAPIIYTDAEALEHLFEVADMVLTYDRNIVAPQDDSVIQYTASGQKIIVRRSRGLAPNYFTNPFANNTETLLATGGELKSAFALRNKNNVYISQYLGDQGTLEAQESYTKTLQHITGLLKATPQKILVDQHPVYAVSQFGKALAAQKNGVPVIEIQHHKAHFGAVLAENNLLQAELPVLGFIWDGTGYGEDKKIWGGEIFIYAHNRMERVAHLKYFPQLLGDKMSREPRLSALSLLKDFPAQQELIQQYFSEKEWRYYQKVLQQDSSIYSSSMGRFLDGLACLLGIKAYNSYEGEAAMEMEALARSCTQPVSEVYSLPLIDGELYWDFFLQQFFEDIQQGTAIATICRKVLFSLARSIADCSGHFNLDQLAFSGGVFQNALLVEMVIEQLAAKKHLYFHQQLSPNDECIGFGQLACYEILQRAKQESMGSPVFQHYFSL